MYATLTLYSSFFCFVFQVLGLQVCATMPKSWSFLFRTGSVMLDEYAQVAALLDLYATELFRGLCGINPSDSKLSQMLISF